MSARSGPAVVIGVGNVLLGDDGVGVRIVEELRRVAALDPRALPPETRLVDGGTLGLGLLDVIRGARSLLVVDAVQLDREPGTVLVLRGPAAEWGAVGELLATARLMGWLPDEVSLVGVQAAGVGVGVGLSPCVEAALPRAVDAVRAELRVQGRQAPPAITEGAPAAPGALSGHPGRLTEGATA